MAPTVESALYPEPLGPLGPHCLPFFTLYPGSSSQKLTERCFSDQFSQPSCCWLVRLPFPGSQHLVTVAVAWWSLSAPQGGKVHPMSSNASTGPCGHTGHLPSHSIGSPCHCLLPDIPVPDSGSTNKKEGLVTRLMPPVSWSLLITERPFPVFLFLHDSDLGGEEEGQQGQLPAR